MLIFDEERRMKEYKFEEIMTLPYGENPHQTAGLYAHDDMADYKMLFNTQLSYDNVLNLNEVTAILSEFFDVNAVAIAKHETCCGVAMGSTTDDAYQKAFDCDPVSAFYGTIGFTKTVDEDTAKHISSMGVKLIIAPDYDFKALEILHENPNLRLIKLNTPLKDFRVICKDEIRVTPFGVLIQEKNESNLSKHSFEVVTKVKPTPEQIENAIFAWKVVKHTKTDSAVVVKDLATVGIAQGQSNSTSAVEHALNIACDNAKDAVLATDGAIYSQDAIFAAVQSRVGLIIQPGGSYKDKQLIELADKYGISMIVTGIRNHKF